MDAWQDFQGTWQAVWVAEDGRKLSAEAARDTSLTISGHRYTLRSQGHDFRGAMSRVGRTRRRGAVDFVADGSGDGRQAWRGIYVLGDDELSVCVAPPGRQRPTSFAARPGSGHWLYLLRRHVPPVDYPVAGAALGSGVLAMDTIAYHQKLAVLAHERGDYLGAARHYQDAANCYPSAQQRELCLKLAEEELAQEGANPVILVES